MEVVYLSVVTAVTSAVAVVEFSTVMTNVASIVV